MSRTLTAQQLTGWIDTLRHLSAEGLFYANNEYDRERYITLQAMVIEMTAFITDQTIETLQPFRENFFSRWSPLVSGAAAVIDDNDKVLLMRRSDNGLWGMPGGGMNVGETPAQAVVRETFEETGIRCKAVALVGVYDSRLWKTNFGFNAYLFTFLCRPLEDAVKTAGSLSQETLMTGWFPEDALPENIIPDHIPRIRHAYQVRRGNASAYFDI
jgi:8-oxo-dGTP pyrophosphatase MutT (NUDIX family)